MTSRMTPNLPWKTRRPPVTWSRASHISLVIVVLATHALVASACPQDCACYRADGGQAVSCRYQNLGQVPRDLPSDTLELDMGHNYLPKLDVDTFPSLPLLRRLIIDWCQVETIQEGAFSSLDSVEYIKLSHNSIKEVHPTAFRGLRGLKRLHLDNNQLRNLSHSLFNELVLDELLLHANGIQILDDKAFHGSSIVNLNLDENNISNISMEMLTPLKSSLKNFNLSHNEQPLKLDDNVFSGFNFSDLKISYDGLKDPSFLKHIKAHSLDISGHPFAKMDFTNYTNFRVTEKFYLRNLNIDNLNETILLNMVSVTLLDLSFNQLVTFDGDVFRYTPWLRVLRLDGNLFISLPENMGMHLHNLQMLMVPMNKLAMVRPDAFQGMDSLVELDMRKNHIQVIEESMRETLSRLTGVHLGGNPLHCNCEMRWYRRWLNDSGLNTGAFDCFSPSDVSMFSLDPSEFVCRPAEVKHVSENTNSQEGDSVFLSCNAEGDPAPEVQWSSPFGEVVSVTPPFNRTRYMTSAIWHVSRIRRSQGGWYTCTATNRKGSHQRSTYIHVYPVGGTTIDVDNMVPPTTMPLSTTTTIVLTTPTPTIPPTTPTNATTIITPPSTPSKTEYKPATTTTESTSTTASTTPYSSTTQTSPYVGPDDGGFIQGFPPWVVGVIIGCILASILVVVFIGVCIYKAVQNKYIGRYDFNRSLGEVPTVANNNHAHNSSVKSV